MGSNLRPGPRAVFSNRAHLIRDRPASSSLHFSDESADRASARLDDVAVGEEAMLAARAGEARLPRLAGVPVALPGRAVGEHRWVLVGHPDVRRAVGEGTARG